VVDTRTRREELEVRLAELGRALDLASEEYRALADWDRLGPHLATRLGDARAAVALVDVEEIVPMVRVVPCPGAPDGILGTFVHRGALAFALDVAALVGRPSAAGADFLVVLAGVPRVGFPADEMLGVTAGADVSRRASGGGAAGAGLVVEGMTADGALLVLSAEALREIARRAGGEVSR
jgi:chemotaxis signal transduction protein